MASITLAEGEKTPGRVYDLGMRLRNGCLWIVLAGLPAAAQTLTNQSLSGKYYFRHISLGTNGAGSLTDPRSLLGTVTFDGAGRYTFAGQQVTGANAAVAQSGSGAYAVDSAGFVTKQFLRLRDRT